MKYHFKITNNKLNNYAVSHIQWGKKKHQAGSFKICHCANDVELFHFKCWSRIRSNQKHNLLTLSSFQQKHQHRIHPQSKLINYWPQCHLMVAFIQTFFFFHCSIRFAYCSTESKCATPLPLQTISHHWETLPFFPPSCNTRLQVSHTASRSPLTRSLLPLCYIKIIFTYPQVCGA